MFCVLFRRGLWSGSHGAPADGQGVENDRTATLLNGSTTVHGAVRYSMMQPDSPFSALPLRNAVVYCSLAPVTAQFVADGNMEMG